MEIFNFYNLDECSDRKSVKKKLQQLEDDGKIEFTLDGDILKIEDIDLDENEVNSLKKFFDDNDVFPYLDYEESDKDDFDYDDFEEDDQNDY